MALASYGGPFGGARDVIYMVVEGVSVYIFAASSSEFELFIIGRLFYNRRMKHHFRRRAKRKKEIQPCALL